MIAKLLSNLKQEIKLRFPDRQIYYRTEGQVRYFRISTGTQISAILAATIFSIYISASVISSIRTTIDRRSQPTTASDVLEVIMPERGQFGQSLLESEAIFLRPEGVSEASDTLARYVSETQRQIYALETERNQLILEVVNLDEQLRARAALSNLDTGEFNSVIDSIRFGGAFERLRYQILGTTFFLIGAFSGACFIIFSRIQPDKPESLDS